MKIEEYDAIIFVGGQGASFYWNDPTAHKIVKQAIEKGKIVAATCISPVTLANAGILKNKKATVWPSEADKLIEKGAIYTGTKVEVDDNIITAVGSEQIEEVSEAILKALSDVTQSSEEGRGCE
jgi:protease I